MKTGLLMAGGAVLAARVEIACTPWDRMKGLLGRSSLPPGQAMWFDRCSLLHTCGMRFPIDILFLDRDHRVLSLRRRVAPFRLAWGGPRARVAVEAAGGAFPAESLGAGTRVRLVTP